MNRVDLQVLADDRVSDAEALLQASRWTAGYYLLGYAVECALKACAAKQFRQDEIPDKTFVNNFYTHRLDLLLNLAEIKADFAAQTAADTAFDRNWNTIRDRTEAARYDRSITEARARDLWVAVTDPQSGVLPWLKTHW